MSVNENASAAFFEGSTLYFQSSLKKITLCEGLESIKEEAFYGCTSLKEIVVPSAIGEIRVGAFTGCHENLVVRIVR